MRAQRRRLRRPTKGERCGANGGILVVPQIKAELETALGRGMALSSVCNLLHRHGWRKVAPYKRHPHVLRVPETILDDYIDQ